MKVGEIITRHRHSPIVRRLSHIARRFYERFENINNNDFDTNGERMVLERMARTGLHHVFDVGANRGEWSAELLRFSPEAEIHCFEIVPTTAEHCRKRFADNPRITVNDVGLADHEGTIDVSFWPEDDRWSSTVPGVAAIHGGNTQTIAAKIITGDAYLNHSGIAQIDLLKLDVEGAEDSVLKGFSWALSTGRIAAIQFEYGLGNLASRFFLSDYYAMLGTRFVIGRIFPDGVEFKDFEPTDEHLTLSNYLAVRRDRTDIIALLAARAHPSAR